MLNPAGRAVVRSTLLATFWAVKALSFGFLKPRAFGHLAISLNDIPAHILNFRPSSDSSVLSHELTCLSAVMIC